MRFVTLMMALAWAPYGHGNPLTPQADPRPVLVLSGSSDTFNTLGPWLTLIYTEALGRLGYRLDYRPYPARRSSVMSDSGDADGEIHRVGDYSQLHPELVRVPVSHFPVNFCAYATRPMDLRAGWQALKNTSLRVEYRSGVTYASVQLPRVLPPEQISTVSTVQLALRKLQFGRTDVYVEMDAVVEPLLAQDEFRNAGIRKVGVFETAEVYAHLNRRHADLAVKLGQVLADMKKEGLIEKYRLQAGIPKY